MNANKKRECDEPWHDGKRQTVEGHAYVVEFDR
jgi:hypothetical protein